MSASISISSDQASLVLAAVEPIAVCDPQGQIVGWLTPRPAVDLAAQDAFGSQANDAPQQPGACTLGEAVREIDRIQVGMRFTPPDDGELLRAARAGAMYGHDGDL